jgi:hypothetical protein
VSSLLACRIKTAPVSSRKSETRTGAVRSQRMTQNDSSHDPKKTPPPIPPGSEAALPPGSLPGPFLGPQGDENRTPPPNAPVPVQPTETVEDIDDRD